MDIIILLCIKSRRIRNGVTLSTVYQLWPLRTTVIVCPWVQNYERKYLIQVIKIRNKPTIISIRKLYVSIRYSKTKPSI